MGSYNDIAAGQTASYANVQQIINALSARANIPQTVKVTDSINYAVTAWNTDAAGKGLLIYGADGATVLLSADGTGVKVSPDGTAAVAVGIKNNGHFTTMTIDSGGLQVAAGNIGIGGAPLADRALYVVGTPNTSAATTQYGVFLNPTIPSAVTVEYDDIIAYAGVTTAAAFTLTSAVGMHVANGTKGAGSTITTQYGILVDAMANGGTNNYGIYVNAPSGGAGSNIGIFNNGSMVVGGAATPSVGAGLMALSAQIANTATAGANGAPPAQVASYWVVNQAGSTYKIPLYNA